MEGYASNPSKAGLVTILTQDELDAYFSEGGVKMPDGLSDTRLDFEPGVANGSAQVDFEKVTAKNRSSNPLLSLFTGIHTVRVTADAVGAHGRASVKIQSVSFDGIEIPRAALEFFIQKYLQPKYPEAGLDMVFAMPARVETATIGEGQVTFVQK